MRRKRYTPNQKSMIVAIYLSGKIQKMLDDNVHLHAKDLVVDKRDEETAEQYKDRVIALYQSYNAESRYLFNAIYTATQDLMEILDELSDSNATAEKQDESGGTCMMK